jgi:hypothetical protein
MTLFEKVKKYLRQNWAALSGQMQPRAATRVRVEMRVFRAAEGRWVDLPSVENVL